VTNERDEDRREFTVRTMFEPGRLSKDSLEAAYDRVVSVGRSRRRAMWLNHEVDQHREENGYEECGGDLRAS
jgi:hypothetical protein